ncbi:MAG: KpsF/GutQ family sugar-phosphate isomerase [Helicobacter sp.]|nr:KpsF/GutQ family sugar-phosphate isomerase [Helicobacter sp.]
MSNNAILREVLDLEAKQLLDYDLSLANWEEICKLILSAKGKVVFLGVGKSGLIARKISATFASTGTASFFVHPTEALHGDLGAIQNGDIIFALSYSGESSELLDPIMHLKRQGFSVISMTKNASSLANASDLTIPIKITQEACPLNAAPTCSTTLCLALGDALAILLMQKRDFKTEHFANFHPGGKLGKKLFVKIKDLMQSENLPLISPQTKLQDAILIMSEARLGGAILTSDKKLVGILSDGDLRRAMLRPDFSLQNEVRLYATMNAKFVNDQNMLAFDALALMEKSKIQLLVICENNRVIGALHLHSLISAGIGN